MKSKAIVLAEELESPGESSKTRSRALQTWTRALARELRAPGFVVHAENWSTYPRSLPYRDPWLSKHLEKQTQKLQEIARTISSECEVKMTEGDPLSVILEFAQNPKKYRLLLQGTRGLTGLKRVLLGSVAEEVLRHSRIPVMTIGRKAQKVIRPDPLSGKRRILVCTDLTRLSHKAEECAAELAKELKAELILFHALEPAFHPVLQTAFALPEAQQELSAWLKQIERSAKLALERKKKALKTRGIKADILLNNRNVQATAATCILNELKGGRYTLVVQGTHGRNLVTGGLLGSTARQMVLESPIPVITVRGS